MENRLPLLATPQLHPGPRLRKVPAQRFPRHPVGGGRNLHRDDLRQEKSLRGIHARVPVPAPRRGYGPKGTFHARAASGHAFQFRSTLPCCFEARRRRKVLRDEGVDEDYGLEAVDAVDGVVCARFLRQSGFHHPHSSCDEAKMGRLSPRGVHELVGVFRLSGLVLLQLRDFVFCHQYLFR